MTVTGIVAEFRALIDWFEGALGQQTLISKPKLRGL